MGDMKLDKASQEAAALRQQVAGKAGELLAAQEKAAQDAVMLQELATDRQVKQRQLDRMETERNQRLERQAIQLWEQLQRRHRTPGENFRQMVMFRNAFDALVGDREEQASSLLEKKRARPPSPIRRPPNQHLFAPPPPR